MEKEMARRRHVPAFGKWNYYSASSSSASRADEPPPLQHSAGAAPAESWRWHAPQPEACSDAWFRYAPPPRPRPPAPKKKARRSPVTTAGGRGVAVAVAAEHKRAVPPPAAAERAPAKGARRVVGVTRPVDEDLYQVPPPDVDDTAVSRLPGRRQTTAATARRSLWMGCLGLNCVA